MDADSRCSLLTQTFKDLLADHMKIIDAILSDRDTALRCLSGELDAQGEAFMQDGQCSFMSANYLGIDIPTL